MSMRTQGGLFPNPNDGDYLNALYEDVELCKTLKHFDMQRAKYWSRKKLTPLMRKLGVAYRRDINNFLQRFRQFVENVQDCLECYGRFDYSSSESEISSTSAHSTGTDDSFQSDEESSDTDSCLSWSSRASTHIPEAQSIAEAMAFKGELKSKFLLPRNEKSDREFLTNGEYIWVDIMPNEAHPSAPRFVPGDPTPQTRGEVRYGPIVFSFLIDDVLAMYYRCYGPFEIVMCPYEDSTKDRAVTFLVTQINTAPAEYPRIDINQFCREKSTLATMEPWEHYQLALKVNGRAFPFPSGTKVSFVDHGTRYVSRGNGQRAKCVEISREDAEEEWNELNMPREFDCKCVQCKNCGTAIATTQFLDCHQDVETLPVVLPDHVELHEVLQHCLDTISKSFGASSSSSRPSFSTSSSFSSSSSFSLSSSFLSSSSSSLSSISSSSHQARARPRFFRNEGVAVEDFTCKDCGTIVGLRLFLAGNPNAARFVDRVVILPERINHKELPATRTAECLARNRVDVKRLGTLVKGKPLPVVDIYKAIEDVSRNRERRKKESQRRAEIQSLAASSFSCFSGPPALSRSRSCPIDVLNANGKRRRQGGSAAGHKKRRRDSNDQ